MLEKDVEDNMVCFETIFEEDKDGDQGAFAEKFRDQHVDEILGLLDDIEVGCCRLNISMWHQSIPPMSPRICRTN